MLLLHGDYELLATIVSDHHLAAIRSGSAHTLVRWVKMLPDEKLVEHPELAMAAATAVSLAGPRTIERRRFLQLAERGRVESRARFTPYVDAGIKMVRAFTFDEGVEAGVEDGRRAVEIAEREADDVLRRLPGGPGTRPLFRRRPRSGLGCSATGARAPGRRAPPDGARDCQGDARAGRRRPRPLRCCSSTCREGESADRSDSQQSQLGRRGGLRHLRRRRDRRGQARGGRARPGLRRAVLSRRAADRFTIRGCCCSSLACAVAAVA